MDELDGTPIGEASGVVFNRTSGIEHLAVFRINLDGSNEHQIREIEDPATLSPDGRTFIGAKWLPEKKRVLPELFDFHGSDHSLMPISDPTLNVTDFRWSPNGTRVVAQGWDDDKPDRAGLYSFRAADGRGLMRLTNSGYPNDWPVAYSLDGSTVLFTRETKPFNRDGPMNLLKVETDGSGLVRLNPPGTTTGLSSHPVVASASWSPGGRRVAFAASRGSFWDGERAVFIVDSDGGRARRITSWSCTLNAMWSPDGRWIALDRCLTAGPHDLFVVHPDGSELTQITSAEDGYFSFAPVWSPDSTKLLFVRSAADFDATDLWAVNVDGTDLRRVTDTRGDYESYSWLPRGG